MPSTKEHGWNISSSVLISWITIGGAAWLFAKPILVNAVSDAMGEEIQQAVSASVNPINSAFVALLQRDINMTRKEIAALKFRQRKAVGWTADDAISLTEMEIELDALLGAKAALESVE